MSNQSVVVELNNMSNPLSYACQDLLEKQNYVNLVEVTYLYDLAYPTSLDTGTARLEVESNLLKQIAAVYGLGSGSACTEPPLEGLWVLKASSVPQNGTDVFGKCLELAPSAKEGCISLSSALAVSVVGPEDPNEIVRHISEEMSNGAVSANTNLRVSFLGTHVDVESYEGTGKESLAPAINSQVTNATNSEQSFTPIGISGAVCLALAFIGLVLSVFIRRRRRRQRSEMQAIAAERESQLGDDEEDSMYVPPSKGEIRRLSREVVVDCEETMSDGMSEEYIEVSSPCSLEDMGNKMKNELLGLHGAKGAANPGYRKAKSESEHSESDCDSWAQADATLGCLGVCVETDPMTAEI